MLTMTRDFSTDQLQLIRSFFTEDEWNAIDSALADYQDYGDNEAELMSILPLILHKLFQELTHYLNMTFLNPPNR